jgi:predicted nucleotidyltransferase
MFGLDYETINRVQEVIAGRPEIARAVLYGSRAKGNYKVGSDIDLALFGKGLSLTTIQKLQEELDELYLPYLFDLTIHEQISNQDLRDHIARVGKVFYQRDRHHIS